MLAARLDNFVPILFILVAILFQLLTRLAKTGKRPTDSQRRSAGRPEPRRVPNAPTETDEEQIRKFLEALGQPATSKPPRAAEPRPTYQRPLTHVPPLPSPLPRLRTRPPDSPPQIRLPGQIPPTREAKPFRPTVAETAFEVHHGATPLESAPVIKTAGEAYATATATVAQAPAPKIDLASLLRSPSGLRDAIILREIFGPPRSLQPLDLVGNI